jgi:hypothetical protein
MDEKLTEALLPDGAIAFLKGFFKVDADVRVSAAEALQNPWLNANLVAKAPMKMSSEKLTNAEGSDSTVLSSP